MPSCGRTFLSMFVSYVCGATLPTQDGVTPLHNAAGLGHVVVARLLLDWGADRDAKGKVGVCRSLDRA